MCAKFGPDRFRNKNFYSEHTYTHTYIQTDRQTDKQTFSFIYKITVENQNRCNEPNKVTRLIFDLPEFVTDAQNIILFRLR